jgi:acetyltransferase-like isoleucine patch superfamily enzyme
VRVLSFPGALGLILRRRGLRHAFARCGRGVIFGRDLQMGQPDRISLGDGVILGDRCVLDAGGAGSSRIVLGDGVFVGSGTVLRAGVGSIEIGSGSNISGFCGLDGGAGLYLGEHVLLAAYSTIGDRTGEEGAGLAEKPTVVEDGCWLGVRVRVFPGVRVGHDTVVGAHSVVRDDLPPLAVVFGNPARVRKERRSPS